MTVPVATTTKLKPKPSVSVKKQVKSNESPCVSLTRLFLMVFILFSAVGGYYLGQYNIFNALLGNNHLVNNKGEYAVSSLDNLYSTVFCDKYTVSSNTGADVYLVENGAKVSQLFREIINLSETDAISETSYAYFSSYLLAGSIIKVKGCRVLVTLTEAKILLIKGDDSWNSWKKTGGVSNAIRWETIRRQEVCDFQQMFDLEYTVPSDDNYYIVIDQGGESIPHEKTYVYSRLTLNKTIYDLLQSKRMCTNTKTCSVDLKYASDEDIIVKFRQNWQTHTHLASFYSTCEKRLMFWLGVFVFLPVVIFLLLSVCFCSCLVMERRERKAEKKTAITTALLDNHPKPVRPPSYEETTKPLPTYSVNINV